MIIKGSDEMLLLNVPYEEKEEAKKLGAKWNNSANAGTFYWNLNNASSNRNRNISRQLVNALKTPA